MKEILREPVELTEVELDAVAGGITTQTQVAVAGVQSLADVSSGVVSQEALAAVAQAQAGNTGIKG